MSCISNDRATINVVNLTRPLKVRQRDWLMVEPQIQEEQREIHFCHGTLFYLNGVLERAWGFAHVFCSFGSDIPGWFSMTMGLGLHCYGPFSACAKDETVWFAWFRPNRYQMLPTMNQNGQVGYWNWHQKMMASSRNIKTMMANQDYE